MRSTVCRDRIKIMNRRYSGFTLVELIVAISIFAILSSIVLASVSEVRAKSRDAQRLADLEQFQLALEQYYDEFKMYPCGEVDEGAGLGVPTGTQADTTSLCDAGTYATRFIDGDLVSGNNTSCVTTPTTGLITQGFYHIQCNKDPINSYPHFYFYHVTMDLCVLDSW